MNHRPNHRHHNLWALSSVPPLDLVSGAEVAHMACRRDKPREPPPTEAGPRPRAGTPRPGEPERFADDGDGCAAYGAPAHAPAKGAGESAARSRMADCDLAGSGSPRLRHPATAVEVTAQPLDTGPARAGHPATTGLALYTRTPTHVS
ncbi:hypothetical protein JCM18897A_49140 [Streptomyces sp. JCM 18897]